jgi:predicted dehydrogenase
VFAITTPPPSHPELVHRVVGAGHHVVCEKPFAADVAQARGMLDAAERAGIVHVVGCEFRFDTAWALLGRVARDGTIGDPLLTLEVLQVPTLADPRATVPAWFDDAAQGGGWLGGSAPHILDRVRSTLGEFTRVTGSVRRIGPRPGVTTDDTYTVTFTLDSGVEGTILSSAAVGGPPMVVSQVTGTRGTAWIDAMTRDVWVDDGHGPRTVAVPADLVKPAPVPPHAELLTSPYEMWHSTGNEVIPYARLYRAVRARIADRAAVSDPPLPTFEDAVALQTVMDAIRRSSEEHATVELD